MKAPKTGDVSQVQKKPSEADTKRTYDDLNDLSEAEIEFLNTLIGLAVDEWHSNNE